MRKINKELLKENTFELKLEEILSFAVIRKIKAQKLYEEKNEISSENSLDSVIDHLIEEEKSHEGKIRSILDDFFPDKDIEDFNMDIGYDPSKNTEIKFESYTINELLERAIEKEKYSSKFYRTMAERADEDTFSNILSYLAYVENEHRNVLQKELSGRK